ncbi:uncharacterized protein LOC107782044 [Nicotiana tabacum]|uniref:Uncharacterized protein LOC107782044 n=1 Tax=Nicotiana tabacum TaxID=4097 RepID=A0A1S3Z1M6_TOBAC|nr:PREDICTED: uncharacterized protein LOC107782044 [Nicotiana tabacum]
MSSSMSLLRNSIPLISILVPPYLLFASFSGYGVISISITTSVLIVSTLAFTFSKQRNSIQKKSVQEVEKQEQEAVPNSQLMEQTPQVKQMVSDQQPQNANFGQVEEILAVKKPGNENGVAQILDLYSESSSLGRHSSSSEDSDIDWPFSDISDVYEEDNLIEIDISIGSIKCSGFEISA